MKTLKLGIRWFPLIAFLLNAASPHGRWAEVIWRSWHVYEVTPASHSCPVRSWTATAAISGSRDNACVWLQCLEQCDGDKGHVSLTAAKNRAKATASRFNWGASPFNSLWNRLEAYLVGHRHTERYWIVTRRSSLILSIFTPAVPMGSVLPFVSSTPPCDMVCIPRFLHPMVRYVHVASSNFRCTLFPLPSITACTVCHLHPPVETTPCLTPPSWAISEASPHWHRPMWNRVGGVGRNAFFF